MGGDEKKRSATTKRFTHEELAELASRARADAPVEEPPAEPRPITPMSRSVTLHDPLTTQLLAEVARRVQTTEFDVDADELLAADPDTRAPSHPHALRRKS